LRIKIGGLRQAKQKLILFYQIISPAIDLKLHIKRKESLCSLRPGREKGVNVTPKMKIIAIENKNMKTIIDYFHENII
jgi:hypothetical protein